MEDDAIRTAETFDPDVVLMSMSLEEGSGPGFLDRWQRADAARVVVYARVLPRDAATRAMELGVDAYLEKATVTPNAIVQIIERLGTGIQEAR